jgi:hypothetical protein
MEQRQWFMKRQDMKKDDHRPARKRSGKPKAAKPMAHAKSLAKPTDRSAVLSKKLRSFQIRIAESKRPVHQIQQFPEIIRHIREFSIPEYQKHFDAPTDRAVLQRLAAYLAEPVTPCLSFHFPLPEAASQLIEDLDDWDEIQDAMVEWATQELDAIATVYIHVENLCEGCRECIEFTQLCFSDEHADEYTHCDEKVSLSWRNIGSEVAITSADFKAGRKSVCTGQWEVPQQEISDLFNRSLPPELAMVYFDADGSNGLYVLMKTADLGRIESFY